MAGRKRHSAEQIVCSLRPNDTGDINVIIVVEESTPPARAAMRRAINNIDIDP